jgi:hypothetical protein
LHPIVHLVTSQAVVTRMYDEKIGLSVMNMLGLSSSVHFAHIACYRKIFPFALRTSPLSVQALQDRSCPSYISYAATAA